MRNCEVDMVEVKRVYEHVNARTCYNLISQQLTSLLMLIKSFLLNSYVYMCMYILTHFAHIDNLEIIHNITKVVVI